MPAITQPNVYFGLGETGYVVANSKQLEVDYQKSNGTNVESHYTGTGGVQLSSIFTRAAFALRLGDFNLLISSQITNKSRIMFIRDPVAMAQTAAPVPHLRPRPLRGDQQDGAHRLGRRRLHDNGQLRLFAERGHPAGGDREQPARELQLRAQFGEGRDRRLLGEDDVLRRRSEGPDSAGVLGGLPEHVHADVEDAGVAAGPPALPAGHLLHSVRHLRALPPDQPAAFYAASNAWQLSPTAGAGPQSQALLAQNTYNNQGQLVSTTPARMAPQYQVYSLPEHRSGPAGLHGVGRLRARHRRRTCRGRTRTST